MIRVQTKHFGELSLFVNKGAIGEFEDYFGKTWIQIVIGGMNYKHWIVLIHRCYLVACYRERKEAEHSLKDLESFLEPDEFDAIIKEVDLQLEIVLELSKITKQLEDQTKAQKKRK